MPLNKNTSRGGHESVLNMLQKKHVKTTIATVDGNTYSGFVRAYDKFTISLIDENETTLIIFKSAVKYFCAE